MANSRRKLIRQKVREILLNKTDAKERVFTNRASATWCEELPMIAVYTRAESSELLNAAPREYKRTLEVLVEVIATGSESPANEVSAEDVIDDLTDQVERELGRDETLGEIPDPMDSSGKRMLAIVDEMLLQNIEFAFRGEGKKPEAAALMLFNMVYHTYSPISLDEQDGIGTLEKVHAEWRIKDEDEETDDPEAEDDLAIPS